MVHCSSWSMRVVVSLVYLFFLYCSSFALTIKINNVLGLCVCSLYFLKIPTWIRNCFWGSPVLQNCTHTQTLLHMALKFSVVILPFPLTANSHLCNSSFNFWILVDATKPNCGKHIFNFVPGSLPQPFYLQNPETLFSLRHKNCKKIWKFPIHFQPKKNPCFTMTTTAKWQQLSIKIPTTVSTISRWHAFFKVGFLSIL